MIKGKHVEFHYLVSYRDSSELPRAWGKAPTEEAADIEAKRQLEIYKRKQTHMGEPPEEYTRHVSQCSTERVQPLAKKPEARVYGAKAKPSVVKTKGPKTAKAGEAVATKALERLKRFNFSFPGTIQPKADPPSASGQWVCADCGEPFQNNASAHGHTKTHRLAWWTGVHLEEP